MTQKKDIPQAPAPQAWPQPHYAYPTAYAQPVAAYPQPQKLADPYQQASARILQDRNATVAKVSVDQTSSFDFGTPPDFSFIATGSSKREQGDRFNPRTGELLALSRAYLNLSRQLYAAGKELIEPEPAPEFEAAMQVMDELVAAAESEPEDNFIGIGAYPDVEVLQDPTDEDVELAKEILAARAAYNAAVAEHDNGYGEIPTEQLDDAVKAFNAAAEALNTVRATLGQFV
jgi:hypothetical protein